MTQDEVKRLEAELPPNTTALFFSRGEKGELVAQGASKWEKRFSADEGRAHHFALGVFQLFSTASKKVEQLGYLRSRADILSALLERMPEEDKSNVVSIMPMLMQKKTEEIVPNGS